MKLLLDTHIFLWFISGDKRLTDYMQDNIRNPDNEVYLSVVSLWEAIVKYQLGKLPLPQPPDVYLPIQRQKHQIAVLYPWMKPAWLNWLTLLKFTVIRLLAVSQKMV